MNNKEISTRKQRKMEKIRIENIQKFDEEYKKNRIISQEYKKSIKTRVLKNSLIAIIAIIYLILINVLSSCIETHIYILGIKIVTIILSIVSVVFFELSYQKDNEYLFLYGVEFLILATITLFSVNAYSLLYVTYNKILYIILGTFIIYYILKTIITIKNMKKQYYKEQSDIKDIVKKEKRKND